VSDEESKLSVESPVRTTTVDTYRTMLVIRAVEQRLEALFRDGKVRGAMHLAIGQEAVAAGTCAELEAGDRLSFTYRSHAWALARGITPLEVMAECLGRTAGCSRGRGGSKHLADWSRGVLPSNAIVGANVPLAVGTALAAKLQGEPAVTIAVFGDGALNQAVVHEALTQAKVWSLPVVFVCENNLYAELTPVQSFSPVAELVDRARGYDLPAAVCDGMDVADVRAVVGGAIGRARGGDGPTFVEARTYRFCGHMTGDSYPYRPKDEVEDWRRRDPISTARATLVDAEGEARLDALAAEVEAEVRNAEAAALASPPPDPADLLVGAPSWSVRS
jgi:TPP-dependent pyruvate/acetoin dehydrogenase alpha subunit